MSAVLRIEGQEADDAVENVLLAIRESLGFHFNILELHQHNVLLRPIWKASNA